MRLLMAPNGRKDSDVQTDRQYQLQHSPHFFPTHQRIHTTVTTLPYTLDSTLTSMLMQIMRPLLNSGILLPLLEYNVNPFFLPSPLRTLTRCIHVFICPTRCELLTLRAAPSKLDGRTFTFDGDLFNNQGLNVEIQYLHYYYNYYAT